MCGGGSEKARLTLQSVVTEQETVREVELRSERAWRPPGDPNHTQAMHYRRNQGGVGQGTHRVQSTTPLALRFASPSRGHGETSLREDGVEFKQLDEGPVRDKRSGIRGAWFVVLAWGCGLAVEPGLRQHRSAAVGGESGAELSGDHALAGAMERAGAEAGAGRGGAGRGV
ncbi:hypothetical protein NQZ68_004334 [Dissostichus eleginoides]|nr:hypothetical protein NQZ68_004334 [Dissostichus eleginoides]